MKKTKLEANSSVVNKQRRLLLKCPVCPPNKGEIQSMFGKPESLRDYQLARWAEKYGIPALNFTLEGIEGPAKEMYEAKNVTATSCGIRQALATLPKEEGK